MVKRKKASDIFREENYLLSQKVGFEEAFPHIEDYRIEVSELSDMIWKKNQRTVIYTKKHSPGEFVDCTNPTCYSGGVSIGEVLRNMVSEHKTEAEVSKKCQGYEGSAKGGRQYRSCMHVFKIKVRLNYGNASA